MLDRFSVILAAGGSSARFGRDKLSAELAGRTVIGRSAAAFIERDDVAEVWIASNHREALQAVLQQNDADRRLLGDAKLRWCAGGETRAHTVQIAAQAATSSWLAVHDAARPLVSRALIDRVFAAARADGAAAPALPVHLTVKRAVGPLPARVVETVPRQNLWAMQTPQAMRRSDLLRCLTSSPLPLDQLTDDVQPLELQRLPVTLVAGEESNLKLTHATDLALALLHLRHE
ncbi:MAG TPA: 2-C-methyl-D-erythritol 4-phosphate cytidylyltransferase [Tepidisphaeraceae bacterium]|jgi:2-C-methyl-D-erythritol 4-phosphate cytidylyltransferase